MIVYDNNKEYRNLQEQVAKNQDDIETIKQALGNALPDPIEGPQGEPGERGPEGPEGPRGNTIKTVGLPLPSPRDFKEGDLALVIVSPEVGNLYKVTAGRWVLQCNIRGAQGVPGPRTQVIVNPIDPATDNLSKIKVDGVVYEVSDVTANPGFNASDPGLKNITINGTVYNVHGDWAKFLNSLLYEEDGGVTCDGQFVANNSILVDSIASTVDQDTPVTISAITTTNEVTVGDDLYVGANASVDNDLDVGNDLTVYGDIMITDADSLVDENGDPIISGSLANMVTNNTDQIITGAKSFTNGIAVSGGMSINGDVESTDNINASGFYIGEGDDNGMSYDDGSDKLTLYTTGGMHIYPDNDLHLQTDGEMQLISTGGVYIDSNTEVTGDLEVTGDVVAGTGKSVKTNRIDLTGNNNVIHFQSSSYSGNSKLHDDTQNTDTKIENLMDGKRVIVHNLRLVFNADSGNNYPTGSRLGFQINASKSGITSVATLNNYPVGLFQGIPAWFDFNDHDRPIPGILVDANFGTTGHLKFCYYDHTLGYYTVLDLLTANISMVMDTRTAQV